MRTRTGRPVRPIETFGRIAPPVNHDRRTSLGLVLEPIGRFIYRAAMVSLSVFAALALLGALYAGTGAALDATGGESTLTERNAR